MTNLRNLRDAAGLSRDALARIAGVHSKTIEAHENGVSNDVLYSIAKRIGDALHAPLDSLFLPADNGLRIKADALEITEDGTEPLTEARANELLAAL